MTVKITVAITMSERWKAKNDLGCKQVENGGMTKQQAG